jgi:hypothetical protein
MLLNKSRATSTLFVLGTLFCEQKFLFLSGVHELYTHGRILKLPYIYGAESVFVNL